MGMNATELARLLARPKSLLVVDDDALIRLIFKELENTHDCHVTFAPTGKEAIELLRKEKFDFVFLDMKLGPIDSGMDVLRYINASKINARITIMSGSVNLHDLMQEANNLGVLTFFAKPLDFTVDFLAKILDGLYVRRKQENPEPEPATEPDI